MRQITEDDGTISVILADEDEWDSFVDENHDAILERYESVEDAYIRTCQGA